MDETKALAKELRKHERRRGKRYPKELEARVRACIAAHRVRGESIGEIATQLGMVYETVRRWSMSTSSAALVPVTVVDEPSACGATLVSARGATLVSPTGYRVEGLELRDLAALLRALG